MKRFARFLTAAVMICSFNPATAQIFFDDFNDNNANGWSPLNASRWRVETQNGSPAYCLYAPSTSGDEFSTSTTQTWSNFTLELDAKSTASSNRNFFILFNVASPSSVANGYYLQFGATAINLFRIGVPGSGVIIYTEPRSFTDNQYHRIRIVRQAPSMALYVDDQFIFQVSDGTYTSGYIGFGSFNSTGCIDNVAISPSTSGIVGPLVYASQSLDDNNSGASSGDGDGVAESCEKIELIVSLKNIGSATATGVNAKLSSSDPDVTILDDDDGWPDIAGGATQQSNFNFVFKVNPGLAQNKAANFTLNINTSNGGSFTSGFSVNLAVQNSFLLCDREAQLTALSNGTVAWADFINNDGNLDLILIGQDAGSREVTKVYQNTGGGFTDISATAALIGVRDGAVAWGDYDNDDDLDLLLSGDATSSAGLPRVTQLYRYDFGGRFTPISTSLPGVRNGAAAWGDYDNDGDLDLLLTGSPSAGVNIAEIYQNTNESFAAANAGLTGVAGGSAAAWGDYDADGDLDLVLAGEASPNNPVTKIYQNHNGSFSAISASLTGVAASAVAWGDYDNDGDLDLLLAGRTSSGGRVTQIYQNSGGNFSNLNATALTGVESGSVAWGDYDNDGDLDILLTGDASAGAVAKIFRNNAGSFVDLNAVLVEAKLSSAAWGDFDNDGDLDILLSGLSNAGRVSIIYQSNRSNPGKPNTPPAAPANLTFSVTGNSATLNWNKATDAETAQNGLTYNLRLGNAPNGVQIVSPMSRLTTGFRRLPKIGNTGHRNSLAIKNLPLGTYYWSVQAVDNHFAGSPFATTEGRFSITNQSPTVVTKISDQTLVAGGASFTQDLKTVFSDPDGDVLSFSAASNAPSIAPATVPAGGNVLTVTPLTAGSATITATANDGKGGSTPTSFTVTVITAAAKTLHVSKLGNDNNSGSATAPLQTIQTALTRAVDGDTIKVAAGAYDEGLFPTFKVILLGGYSNNFFASDRNIFFNAAVIRAVSSTILTDTKGCTIDGFVFDGNNVAETGLDLRAAATVTHNVILRIKKGVGYGANISGATLFANNTVVDCIRAINTSGSQPSAIVVKNNIVTNSSFGIIDNVTNGVHRYNCFFNNVFNYAGSANFPGVGDISLDPKFLNAAAEDYRVQVTSPTLDAGDSNDPVGAEPAPNGNRVDMGAYGGTKNATVKLSAPLLAMPADGATGQPLTPTLSWNASTGAATYRLQVATNISFPASAIVFDDSTIASTSRQVGPLSSNTTYFWRVNAKNSFGTSAYSSVFRFTTAIAAPALASLNPASGNRLQTLNVVFAGANFSAGITSVNVGTGITVNSTAVNSSTQLTANLTITAAAATGPRSFSVTNSGAGTSNEVTFTVNNPAPTLTSLSPTSGSVGQTLDVVFTGANFFSDATTANVGSGITVNSISVTSATSLTANITITNAAATGGRNFSVATASPGGGTSTAQTFTVQTQPMMLTSISPTSGNRLQTLDVVFTGTNFTSGLTVNVGAGITVNTTTLNSSTQITANLTITAAAATGTRNFSVGSSNSQIFTVNNPAPGLTSLSPNSGSVGQTLDVVFTGANFFSDATTVNVSNGITVNAVNVTSTTSLTANITISASAIIGTRNFSVLNAAPGGGTSNPFTFTVQPQTVTLASISPSSGNRLQTLDVVFTGTNFTSGLAVNAGAGITVNSTTLNSSTQLTANLTITAAAATGVRNFSVGSSNSQTFTVNNPVPALTSLNPVTGNVGQTLDVVFTGTNFFSDATTVTVGSGITVNSFNVTGTTSLTANITISASATLGVRNFSVMNAAPGGGTSTTQTFTVQSQTVTLTSISPSSGNRLQTLNVVFTGTNFNSGLIVNAGAGITVNTTTLNSSTQLTANLTITAAATGARNFSVGTSNSQTFTVTNPAPTLTGINPATARTGQTLNVVFAGTNFLSDATTVNVGSGITANSVNVTSATSLTASLTIAVNATAGSRNFSVINAAPGGGASTSQTFAVSGNTPPSLTHAPATMQPKDQSLLIAASVTDDGGIAGVQLNYRRAGDLSFTAAAMMFTSCSNYQATIPPGSVTSRGVEYFITATDVDNVAARIPAAANGIFSVPVQLTSESKPSAQPSGSVASAYRLISVPLQLDNASAAAVLEDDLGAYDNTKWRLYGLSSQSQTISIKEPYIEFPNAGDFAPGKSLFLIVRDPGKTVTVGAAKSVRTDQEFSITLPPGHNLVATPFNFAIPANKLRLQSGDSVALRTYTGSYVSATEMQPWEGYYLANLNTSNDVLLVNPNLSSSAAPLAAMKIAVGDWRLQILARCGEARDEDNFAGVALASQDDYDGRDLAEPPPIGDYVSVYFPHPEWQKSLDRFSDDIRSSANANQQWRFHVATNIAQENVTLQFKGLSTLDPALAVFLVDEAVQYKQNLREQATYQYQPHRDEPARVFTLVAGKDEFVSGQTANAQGVPDDFVLEHNFPNPFAVGASYLLQQSAETAIRFGLPEQSIVTLKIFDVAGHEVAALLDRAELPAGRHQRLWDGRDAQGRVVVSGIYFCRLTAGSVAKTVKVTVMR